MYDKAARILAQILNVDVTDITAQTPLMGDDGLSEADFARLLIGCEVSFKTTVYDIDAVEFGVFGDLVRYLEDNCAPEARDEKHDDAELFDYDAYFYSE